MMSDDHDHEFLWVTPPNASYFIGAPSPVQIDRMILPLMAALWHAGFVTHFCCQGDGEGDPAYILFGDELDAALFCQALVMSGVAEADIEVDGPAPADGVSVAVRFPTASIDAAHWAVWGMYGDAPGLGRDGESDEPDARVDWMPCCGYPVLEMASPEVETPSSRLCQFCNKDSVTEPFLGLFAARFINRWDDLSIKTKTTAARS